MRIFLVKVVNRSMYKRYENLICLLTFNFMMFFSLQDCSTPTRTSAGGMLISSVPPTSSSIEDATIPLTKPVSDLQPGIMIFQCGTYE